MKKSFIILLSSIALGSFAQSKPDCESLLNDLENYYREGFNEKAILTEEGREKTLNLIQKTAKECPLQSKNTYVFGEEMLLQIIKPMNIGETKQKWTHYLTDLYDQYGQHFPSTKKENDLKKTIALYNNKVYSSEQAFKSLDKLYATDKQTFTTEALLIYADMVASQGHKQQNLSSDFIKKTDDLSTSITAKISELEKKKADVTQKETREIETDLASLKIASRNISGGLKVADINCDAWNNLYKEDFEKNKSNVYWLENALSRLTTYKCSANNELFNTLAQTYYNLEKNSISAYYLGNIAQQQKDYKKAHTFFNESAALETDKAEKAKIYYRISDFYRGNDKAQAKLYLEKSIENDPEMIQSYIMLSQLYAAAERNCFNDDFEYKTRYFLASQTLDRIAKINPRYKTATQKLSDSYLEKAPSKEEVRKSKMKGQTLTLGCWINQQVLVP